MRFSSQHKRVDITEFALQLVKSPKGRVEFCISPREHSEIECQIRIKRQHGACSRQRCERRSCRRYGFWNLWRHAVRGGTNSGFTVPIGLGNANENPRSNSTTRKRDKLLHCSARWKSRRKGVTLTPSWQLQRTWSPRPSCADATLARRLNGSPTT